MFSLFKKKYSPQSSLDFIQTDMHDHVLPGVDDGAVDMEESIKMLRLYSKMGWKKIVLTPHVNEDYYPNRPEALKQVFEKLKKQKDRQNIPLDIELAAEYKTDALFKAHFRENKLLSFENNRVLIELPFFQAPLDWEQYFFDLQMKGFRPILAHAERYLYWKLDLEKFDILHNRGVELQLNLSSIIGKYGPDVQSLAEQLIRRQAYSWIATDAHSANDLIQIAKKLPAKWPAKLNIKQYQNNVDYAN
ncbi:MAG: hypothetical protein GVX96_04315 [Bacteroidetes bacterium]|jgi:protein-tyrosine phosphatase|nr:hypothetical protein [Bacteroidota bacterium]